MRQRSRGGECEVFFSRIIDGERKESQGGQLEKEIRLKGNLLLKGFLKIRGEISIYLD